MKKRRLVALLCLVAALAGCGGSDDGGEATLWVTRDRGAEVVLSRTVPAGVTAMQALRSEGGRRHELRWPLRRGRSKASRATTVRGKTGSTS